MESVDTSNAVIEHSDEESRSSPLIRSLLEFFCRAAVVRLPHYQFEGVDNGTRAVVGFQREHCLVTRSMISLEHERKLRN